MSGTSNAAPAAHGGDAMRGISGEGLKHGDRIRVQSECESSTWPANADVQVATMSDLADAQYGDRFLAARPGEYDVRAKREWHRPAQARTEAVGRHQPGKLSHVVCTHLALTPAWSASGRLALPISTLALGLGPNRCWLSPPRPALHLGGMHRCIGAVAIAVCGISRRSSGS